MHGILVQLPLPKQIDAQQVLDAIDPGKDVDGFHPVNAGRLASGLPALVPCTPLGCVMLAKTVHPSLAGLEAVVIGRSNIVGKPLAQLLLAENATVTVAHSKTRDLPAVCRRADLLVAAVGRPEMVRGDWIKPGATVIDVGINRVPGADGKSKLVGDVAFAEGAEVAGAITPVPGGVGPMTIACLMVNTVRAACAIARIAGACGVKLQRTRLSLPLREAMLWHAPKTKARQMPGIMIKFEFRISYSRRRRPYRGSFRRNAPRSGRPPCRRAPCRTPPPDRCRTAPRPPGSSVRSGQGRGAPR